MADPDQESCPGLRTAAQVPTQSEPAEAMIHNDVLRSVRYMLDLSDVRVLALIRQVDPTCSLDVSELKALLLREGESGFVPCSDALLGHFLDGLMLHFRGPPPTPPPPNPARISNNLVLKKLRVAFQLRDVDLHAVFAAAGFPLSRPELSALFRQPGHANYRVCGDQLLRNFLKGLTLFLRAPASPA